MKKLILFTLAMLSLQLLAKPDGGTDPYDPFAPVDAPPPSYFESIISEKVAKDILDSKKLQKLIQPGYDELVERFKHKKEPLTVNYETQVKECLYQDRIYNSTLSENETYCKLKLYKSYVLGVGFFPQVGSVKVVVLVKETQLKNDKGIKESDFIIVEYGMSMYYKGQPLPE